MSIKNLLLLSIIITQFSCDSKNTPLLILKDIETINIHDGSITTQSILIEEGSIKQIEDFDNLETHQGAEVMECQGKYLIPGLFDMHMHIIEYENSTPQLKRLLLNGITAIRDMGGIADSISVVKAQINSGQLEGPHIYFSGVTLDGKETNDPFHTPIYDTTDLKAYIDGLVELDIDFLKVHNYFPKDRFSELVEMASNHNLKVVGHIPVGFGPKEIVSDGLRSIEHANSLLSGLVRKKSNGIENIDQAFAALDSAYIKSLSDHYIAHQAAFTPTLYTLDDMYKEQEEESVRAIGQKMMERFFEITAQMNEHGVTILAGSDMGPINDYTIDVLHQELVMLVDAGLSNLDALKTATLNPAIFMEIDDQYGSIEINKKADLLILHSNPLEDISNTKDIAFVLKEGKIINSHKMETNNN